VVNAASALDRIEQVSASIAQRAYEIFENDGRIPGHELDHCFRAEAELLHPMHVEIAESDDVLTVRAEVTGYKAEALEVSVGPRRVTITGKREAHEQHKTDRIVYAEHYADRILRVLELPTEIDTSKSTTTLKHGVLEVVMAKATGAPRARSASRSA
jgi:HSP20 family molecular chaperone IbpA